MLNAYWKCAKTVTRFVSISKGPESYLHALLKRYDSGSTPKQRAVSCFYQESQLRTESQTRVNLESTPSQTRVDSLIRRQTQGNLEAIPTCTI